jgi:Arc/MetJ family transcription regulator
MKKTLHIDEALLASAKSAVGAQTDTDTVRLGLEALVRKAAYARLAKLGGSEPLAKDVRRPREAPKKKTTSSRTRAA